MDVEDIHAYVTRRSKVAVVVVAGAGINAQKCPLSSCRGSE